jgi:hypothetical protein
MAVIKGGSVIPGGSANYFAHEIGAASLATNAVHAAVAHAGTTQVVTTAIQHLDRPRRLTATAAASTLAHIKAISVTAQGTDALGNQIEEVLPAFTDNTAGTVTGVRVFASVTSISIPPHDGSTATTAIGAAGLPAAADTDGILEAQTDTGTQVVILSTDADSDGNVLINQPEVPRNITATAGGTSGDVKAITVTIVGTNIEGKAITEVLPAFTVNTTGDVVGSKAFASVTSITIPAHDGTGATTSIGFGEKLGLDRCLSRNTVKSAYRGGTLEGTAPTVVVDDDEIEKNTVDLNSSLNSTQVVVELVD